MAYPTLAGLCDYDEAARLGLAVDESVQFLLRLAWIKKRTMEMGLAWLNPVPEWEVKETLSLHLHLDAEHVGMLRRRIGEMRNPPPPMESSPCPRLDAYARPEEQVNWWSGFVHDVFGTESAMDSEKGWRGDPVYRKDEME